METCTKQTQPARAKTFKNQAAQMRTAATGVGTAKNWAGRLQRQPEPGRAQRVGYEVILSSAGAKNKTRWECCFKIIQPG